MASIYKHRNSWQASVTVNGQNRKKNFASPKEAKAWAASFATELQQAHAPHLGGPAHATVARMLFDYAKLYSVGKRRISQELARINRYLATARLPTWALTRGESARQLTLVAAKPQAGAALPSAFEAHQDALEILRTMPRVDGRVTAGWRPAGCETCVAT